MNSRRIYHPTKKKSLKRISRSLTMVNIQVSILQLICKHISGIETTFHLIHQMQKTMMMKKNQKKNKTLKRKIKKPPKQIKKRELCRKKKKRMQSKKMKRMNKLKGKSKRRKRRIDFYSFFGQLFLFNIYESKKNKFVSFETLNSTYQLECFFDIPLFSKVFETIITFFVLVSSFPQSREVSHNFFLLGRTFIFQTFELLFHRQVGSQVIKMALCFVESVDYYKVYQDFERDQFQEGSYLLLCFLCSQAFDAFEILFLQLLVLMQILLASLLIDQRAFLSSERKLLLKRQILLFILPVFIKILATFSLILKYFDPQQQFLQFFLLF